MKRALSILFLSALSLFAALPMGNMNIGQNANGDKVLTVCGTYNSSGTISNQLAITGIPFKPKAILFFANENTTTNTFAVNDRIGIGFASTPSNRACQSGGFNSGTVQQGSRHDTNACITTCGNIGTAEMMQDLVSMNSDGFTVTNKLTNGTAYPIQYIALGGNAIQNSFVGTTTNNVASGNQSVTGVGFKPDLVVFLQTAQSGALPTSGTQETIMCGAMDKNGGQAALEHLMLNTNPSQAVSSQQSDASNLYPDSTTKRAQFVSMDTDGFTVSWTGVPATAYNLSYLAIKGGNYVVGVDTQKTSTGTQSLSGKLARPASTFFYGWNLIASTTVNTTSDAMNSMGCTDGTNQFSIWSSAQDNVTTTILARQRRQTNACYHNNVISTVSSECSISSFDPTGYTLNWTTADATAREMCYIIFGN